MKTARNAGFISSSFVQSLPKIIITSHAPQFKAIMAFQSTRSISTSFSGGTSGGPAYVLDFPAGRSGGGVRAISWNHSEDPRAVAARFWLAHGVSGRQASDAEAFAPWAKRQQTAGPPAGSAGAPGGGAPDRDVGGQRVVGLEQAEERGCLMALLFDHINTGARTHRGWLWELVPAL